MGNPKKKKTQNNRRKQANSKKSPRLSWIKKNAWILWSGALICLFLYLMVVYYFFVGTNSFNWRSAYQKPIFPEGYDIRGIDVSHYQEEINWELVRNASLNNDPIRFVIIKATEGETIFDEYFNQNFFLSKKNDFIRGAYHFFVPGVSPKKQANFFIRQVHLEPGDLPPVLDVETEGKISKSQLQRDVKIWLDMVEKHYGVKPILYTGYKFKVKYLNDEMFNDYPYWIAHYNVDKIKYKGSWNFWQHTDCGSVNGIKGNVDCNIFNGSLHDLEKLLIKEKEEINP